MSEYTAPALVNNYVSARLLTNSVSGSIMLQVQNSRADEAVTPSVIQIKDSESIFYNDVVISDETSPEYNENIIKTYISNGVVSDTTITPQSPTGYIQGLQNSTHSLSVTNNNIVKKNATNKIDGLEVYYSLSITNALLILVYRSLTGFYYSLDSGNTIIPIPTTGMLYPEQVTSIGIQNISSVTTPGKIKIFAGTLQEGLLSFTLGNSSWVSEVDKERVTTGNSDITKRPYQFRNCSVDANGVYTAGMYSPIYILGIINSPIEAGLPISVYIKSIITHTDLSTVTAIYTVYKYLSLNYISYTLDTVYNIYRQNILVNTDTDWITLINPLTNELCDVLKVIPYTTLAGNNVFSTSKILTAVCTYSISLSKYIVELLECSISNDITGGSSRQLTLTKDTAIGTTIIINPNQFSGLSSFNTDIFITERTKIWRCTNNTWNTWLIANDTTTPELNTCITSDYTFSLISPVSYLSGLRGFGILSNNLIPDKYLGVLNTDLGYVIFNLISTSSDYMVPITNSKFLRSDLFGTSVRDLQIIPENNMAFSCGISVEPITKYILSETFNDPVRYFIYIPQMVSNIPANISYLYSQIFYKNYTVNDTATLPYLINRFNDYNITTVNSDQLYLNTSNTATVAVLKSISEPVVYNDTANNFNWLDNVTYSYVLNSNKYLRLKLLLQTIQIISSIGATLSNNLEIPVIFDMDAVVTVTPGDIEQDDGSLIMIDPYVIDAQFSAKNENQIYAAMPDQSMYPFIYNIRTNSLEALPNGWGAAVPEQNFTSSDDDVLITTTNSDVYACISGDSLAGSDTGIYTMPLNGTDWTFVISINNFIGSDQFFIHGTTPTPYSKYKVNSAVYSSQLFTDSEDAVWFATDIQSISGDNTIGQQTIVFRKPVDGDFSIVWSGEDVIGQVAGTGVARIHLGGKNNTFPYIVDVFNKVFHIWNGAGFTDVTLPINPAQFGLFSLKESPLYINALDDIWWTTYVDTWTETPTTTEFNHYLAGITTTVSLDAGEFFVSDGNLWPIPDGILLFGLYDEHSTALLKITSGAVLTPVGLTITLIAGSTGINKVVGITEVKGPSGNTFVCSNSPYIYSVTPNFGVQTSTEFVTSGDVNINNGDVVTIQFTAPSYTSDGTYILYNYLYGDPDNVPYIDISSASRFTSTPASDATTSYYIQMVDASSNIIWTSPTVNVIASAV